MFWIVGTELSTRKAKMTAITMATAIKTATKTISGVELFFEVGNGTGLGENEGKENT